MSNERVLQGEGFVQCPCHCVVVNQSCVLEQLQPVAYFFGAISVCGQACLSPWLGTSFASSNRQCHCCSRLVTASGGELQQELAG